MKTMTFRGMPIPPITPGRLLDLIHSQIRHSGIRFSTDAPPISGKWLRPHEGTALKLKPEGMAMSLALVIALVLMGVICLAAALGAVVLVIRDGRGEIPLEPPVRPWMAGNLPSRPYSTLPRI